MSSGDVVAFDKTAILDLFSVKKEKLVGLDIGLSSIKIAELVKDGKGLYKLTKYSQITLPECALIEDEIQKKDEIIDAIDDALVTSGINSKSVCLGLFGPNTIMRRLQLAGGTYEEIEDQVVWEAEQYLPFSAEDSKLSFHIIGENEGGGVDVLIAAAKNDVIENYKDMVEQKGLKVKVVDMNVAAVANVFETVYQEHLHLSDKSWLILDFGAQKTSFIIYRKNCVQFSKEMNIGGVMITEEIQRQFGVNYVEAEDLKITGDEKGNLPEEIIEIISDVVDAFLAEIKKTLDFYITATSDDTIENCIITGGGALTPGLIKSLEALIGVNVEILNPFEGIAYDEKKFTEAELSQIAYQGVTALGLGLRELKK